MHRRKKNSFRGVNSLSVFLVSILLFAAAGSSIALTSRPIEIDDFSQRSVGGSKVDVICNQICSKDFDKAQELISGGLEDRSIGQLAEVVSKYQDIASHRQQTRQEAYSEQLIKLEQYQAIADANGIEDINDTTAVLAVITNMTEYASDQQKTELLEKPFVKSLFERIIASAQKAQAEGRWLDAYVECYSWLSVIDKDNEEYSEHAKDLLEKSNIIASFKDSPCETSQERYTGVEKGMFLRALEALNSSYVKMVDYRQMATEALRRSRLLGEVLELSFEQIAESTEADAIETKNEKGFKKPDSDEMSAWQVGLKSLSSQIDQASTGMTESKFLELFEQVLVLNETTVHMPEQLLIAQFSEAALESLDPYTVMIWPKQVQDFEKALTDEFTGVGIEIAKQKGELTATSLLPDTPAYRSGLDAGDIIEEVDGMPTKDMSLTCAVKHITGPRGTKVTLTIKRPDQEKRLKFTITRDRINVPTIRGWQRTDQGTWKHFIDDENKIGYVRITGFSERTAHDFERVLKQLESQGMKGLVMDLRFNPGGLLTSAIEISDMFIEKGLIVGTRPRVGSWSYNEASKRTTHPDYPLVVLINSASASASEIVSGALQDPKYKRAVLVGERTHGKGSVQTVTGYPGGRSQLKFTMAYYHLPSGQRVKSKDECKEAGTEDWGVGPDVEVKLRSDELKEMLDVQKNNDVLVRLGHDSNAAPTKRHSLEETLKADPQLAVGKLIMETKLIQLATKISKN